MLAVVNLGTFYSAHKLVGDKTLDERIIYLAEVVGSEIAILKYYEEIFSMTYGG